MATKSSTWIRSTLSEFAQQFTTGNTVGPWTNTQSRANVQFTRKRTGGSQPQWRSIIKSGGNATTAMTGEDVEVLEHTPYGFQAGYASVPTDPNGYQEHLSGDDTFMVSIPTAIFGTDQAAADNSALSQLYSRLSAQQHEFQGIVALGEVRETIKLLRHPLQAADRLYSSYLRDLKRSRSFEELARRRNRVNKERFLSTAADLHLEVAFGMRPLINDVSDAARALVRANYESPPRVVITGQGKSSVAEDTYSVGGLGNLGRSRDTTRIQTDYIVKYTAYVDPAIGCPAHGSLEKVVGLAGFDLASFVPSIYNLIPYSFLVDYFSNVGDLIEAGVTGTNSVKFVRRSVVTQTTRTVVRAPEVAPAALLNKPRTFVHEAKAGTVVIRRKSVSRTSLAQVPFPSLQLSLPGRSQALNILALLGSSSSSISRRLGG